MIDGQTARASSLLPINTFCIYSYRFLINFGKLGQR